MREKAGRVFKTVFEGVFSKLVSIKIKKGEIQYGSAQ